VSQERPFDLGKRSDSARSLHGEGAKEQNVLPFVRANVARERHVTTDEAVQCPKLGNAFAKHGSVDHHGGEYRRRDNRRRDREWMLLHPQARYDQCIATLRRATFAPLARGI
jgi:hypothetical protein